MAFVIRNPFRKSSPSAATSARKAVVSPPRSLIEPQWLICVDALLKLTCYRMRLGWTGRQTLVPAALPPPGTPYYLVLHPDLPFRRRLQGLPPQAKARAVLLRTAADEFPLEEGTASYCLGLRGQDAYVYALPNSTRGLITDRGVMPDITLVAQTDALDESSCLATLAAFRKFGLTLAFSARRVPPLSRRWLVLNLPLVLGVITAVFLIIWQGGGNDPLSQLLDRHRAELRNGTAMLATRHSATEHMLESNRQLAKLHDDPDAILAGELKKLWQTLPTGNAIRSIEYKQHLLTVTGSGPHTEELLEAGFLAEQISSETIGNTTRFKAERNLNPLTPQ